MASRWVEKSRGLRREVHALYLACRHPQTPWYAKWLAGGIVVYALSPVDLIPDFLPVIGHLDEIVLLPVAIRLFQRMVPEAVMAECRARAADNAGPVSHFGAAIVIAVWVMVAVGALWTVWYS
ncbi:MAG TPA: YkvA family protein [Vicinamibacterales bacterium]